MESTLEELIFRVKCAVDRLYEHLSGKRVCSDFELVFTLNQYLSAKYAQPGIDGYEPADSNIIHRVSNEDALCYVDIMRLSSILYYRNGSKECNDYMELVIPTLDNIVKHILEDEGYGKFGDI